jgi:hypothetical protein
LGAPGSQKLFGSYARFYEQVPLVLPGFYYSPHVLFRLIYDHDPRVDPSGADTIINPFSSAPVAEPAHDLEGQSVDEFALGYERAIGRELRVGLRGVYRALRWALEDAFNPALDRLEVGNPGRGNLSFTPRARRKYTALVLTVEKPVGARFDFLASYVLSRSWGNYVGLYDFVYGGGNVSALFDEPESYASSTGLLPNDRTHVFKFSGAYRFDFGLTVGTAVAWMSGTPRTDYGISVFNSPVLLQAHPRGAAGRMEAVFDANLRLTYELPPWRGTEMRPLVYLDVFQLGNPRTPLFRFDGRYLQVEPGGDYTAADPRYDTPLVFQPPRSVRLGLSVGFGAAE